MRACSQQSGRRMPPWQQPGLPSDLGKPKPPNLDIISMLSKKAQSLSRQAAYTSRKSVSKFNRQSSMRMINNQEVKIRHIRGHWVESALSKCKISLTSNNPWLILSELIISSENINWRSIILALRFLVLLSFVYVKRGIQNVSVLIWDFGESRSMK